MPNSRKTVLLLLVLVGALLTFCSCKGKESNSRVPMVHVGTWSGVDGANTKGVVTFRENGTGTLEFDNSAFDFQYAFDYSKRPVWLDMIYSREGKPFRARLIAKFPDEDHLHWYTFFTEERPAGFPEGNDENVMKLARVSHARGKAGKSM